MKPGISSSLVSLLVVNFLCACVTAPKSSRESKASQLALPQEKAGTNSIGDVEPELRVPTSPPQEGLRTSVGEFFLKHSQPTTVFTSEDEHFLTEMPGNPPSGSIDEAALVVGVLKLSLKQSRPDSSFQESELYDQDDAQAGKESMADSISLEAIALDKQLDLANALASNNLLKNFIIYQQVVRALRSTNNSPEFVTSIKNVIDRQANQWTGEGAQALFDSGDDSATTQGLGRAAVRNSIGDMRSGDSILMEAQALAAGRRYRDAISKASQVDNQSPLFETAQERIVMFSTEAVQELRRKAAQAFQNAIPVEDTKARAAYLEQAKSHLEDALKNYPHAPADQLSTVRENLAVITKDLERLDVDQEVENSGEY